MADFSFEAKIVAQTKETIRKSRDLLFKSAVILRRVGYVSRPEEPVEGIPVQADIPIPLKQPSLKD